MTVRLSAMFEEHVSKIIYNWKVAKRREGAQKNKRSRCRNRNNNRVKYTEENNVSSASLPSSSDSEEVEVEEVKKNGRVNGYTRNNSQHVNKKVASNAPTTSSSDDEPLLPNLKNARHKSDSEESYKPSMRKRAKNYRQAEEDSTSSEDDSDNQPLSVHTTARTTKRLRSKVLRDSSSSSEVNNKMRTRQVKRPKYYEDSDSEGGGRLTRNSDDSNECLTSVSSRGRIRKITARARALFRR